MSIDIRQVSPSFSQPRHNLLRRSFHKLSRKIAGLYPNESGVGYRCVSSARSSLSLTSDLCISSPLLTCRDDEAFSTTPCTEMSISPTDKMDFFQDRRGQTGQRVNRFSSTVTCRSEPQLDHTHYNPHKKALARTYADTDIPTDIPADENGFIEVERSSLLSCELEDADPTPNAVPPANNMTASQATPSALSPLFSMKCNPIDQVLHDMQCLVGGDPTFTVSMESVLSKLVIALRDPESSYLFRDFAGHFVTLLDRFGPGGYDFHRAPVGLSWVLKLIMPWTYLEDDAGMNQVSVYDEVNCWIRNLCGYLGARDDKIIFTEGVWDSCIEHMAMNNPYISDIAYRTAKSVVTSYNIDQNMIYKVLLIRNVTFGYDKPNMGYFRNHHVKLMRALLEKIDSYTHKSGFKDLVMSINREIEDLYFRENDELVITEIQKALDHAEYVYNSLENSIKRHSVRRTSMPNKSAPTSVRSSVNLTHWALIYPTKSNETNTACHAQHADAVPRKRKWPRIKKKIQSLFGYRGEQYEEEFSGQLSDMPHFEGDATMGSDVDYFPPALTV